MKTDKIIRRISLSNQRKLKR